MDNENNQKEPNSYKVFVYGSLKKGFSNHNAWLGIYEQYGLVNYIGYAETVSGKFKMMSVRDSYPAIVMGDGDISGELYEVTSEVLGELDNLEGYPDFYNRVTCPVLCNGKLEYALVYVLSKSFLNGGYANLLYPKSDRISFKDNLYTWEK